MTILLGTWLLVGLVVDGWGHNNLEALETFAPWHALFYSGFVATAGWSWPPPPGPANRSGGLGSLI